MYPDNNWYGHRYILAEYCNTFDKPCFASIQHGWYKTFKVGNRKFTNAPFLCWNEKIHESCVQAGDKNVHLIGSPFLYLDKILKKKNKIKTKVTNGTLFFPAHSAPKTDRFMFKEKDPEVIQRVNHELMIDEITKISKPPYTVCFFYADYTDENISIYKKHNWRIICLGKRSTNNFLYKLHDEISKVDSVICSDLSTTVFYSLYLKKKVKVIFEINKNSINTIHNNDNVKFKNQYYANYPELYDSFLNGEKGYEFAKKELGFNFVKSEEEIKNICGWNNIIKNFFSKIYSFILDLKHGKSLRN